MAISIFLQDIYGKRRIHVIDPDCTQDNLWPVGNPEFPLLQYIDPYGDAVFNNAQMPQIAKELEALLAKSTSEEHRTVLAEVIALAESCRKQPQTFLRFAGD